MLRKRALGGVLLLLFTLLFLPGNILIASAKVTSPPQKEDSESMDKSMEEEIRDELADWGKRMFTMVSCGYCQSMMVLTEPRK